MVIVIDPPIPESYWVVADALVAGHYPFDRFEPAATDKLRKVLSAGVTCFVDLTEDRERDLRPYRRHLHKLGTEFTTPAKHYRMPIVDLGIPSHRQMVETLDLIDKKIEQGHIVYVHCWGGIGRTGTVVGCYLMRHGLAPASSVLDRIADLRCNTPRSDWDSPEMPAQKKMVVEWQKGV